MDLVNAVTGERAFAVVIAAYLIWDVTVNRRELKAELKEVRSFVQTELMAMHTAGQSALNRVAEVLEEFTGRNK